MRILRESAGVIAIWKPAGLATQAPPGIDSAESWLRERLYGGDPRGYVGVPHRIDRGVSGVVLFAATPRAARKLSRQFERRQVRKTYLAIVATGPTADPHVASLEAAARDVAPSGDDDELRFRPGAVRWEDTLLKIPDQAKARIAALGEPQSREAVTFARFVRRFSSHRLLLELEPVTGRMHQLRLQAAVRGLPILGDDLYGGPVEPWNGKAPASAAGDSPDTADARSRSIALHAARIVYADPDSGEAVSVEAPLPDDWPITAG